MKKLSLALGLLFFGSSAFGDTLKGICTGLTNSGKTVIMNFCTLSEGGSRLVACNETGRGRAMVEVLRQVPGEEDAMTTLIARYSRITVDEEEAFAAEAYSITRSQLRMRRNHNWVKVNALAGEPSAFSMDLGDGWKFDFRNAECHFENLIDQQQQ